MNCVRFVFVFAVCLFDCAPILAQSSKASVCKIVLVAGETAKVDTVGHHDYIAGCKCLESLLRQTENIEPIVVLDGWPKDESLFDTASAVVFYTDGGGKQAFLESQERIAKIDSLVDRGVGLVLIHQAVDFPKASESIGKRWLGGVYSEGSGRGHWPSSHVDFPNHEISRGVEPWKVNDGWLNKIHFVDGMKGITPLVWSSKEYAGSRAGLDNDIVAWIYERPDGGRSFSFTGLDAHSAWSLVGMRQLVINGVLWSARQPIRPKGAASKIESAALDAMLTPRQPKPAAVPKAKKVASDTK